MMKRLQLAVASVTLAALVATGTASAATTGSDPKTGGAKPGAPAKVEGKSKQAADADFAAMAAKLGVSAKRLEAAMVAAKRSLAGSTNVTPQAFVAAVAANLGLPVSKVKAVVEPMILKPGRSRDGKDHKAEKDGKDKGANDPKHSPFTTNATAARLAATLGVSQAKAKAALVALVSAPGGISPTSKSFRHIAASLGVSTARLQAALVALKQSLANG